LARAGSREVPSSAGVAASSATTSAAATNTAAPARGHGHDIMLETQMTSTTMSITPPKAHHRLARALTPRQTGPTYYWALPYSNGELPLSEGSVVMRVRLSRDQLRLAGIPLAGIPISDSHDTPDQSLVRAKVLVGADGLPRAISFDQH
jgi:hypothetical protein